LKPEILKPSVARWLIVSVSVWQLCAPAPPAFAQGRIINAQTDTRPAPQGLEREMRAAAARAGVTWVGYRVPMIAGPRQMCCFDSVSATGNTCCGLCRLESGSGVSMSTGDGLYGRDSRIALEPATEFLVLARFEAGAVSRVRTVTPDCDVDAGGLQVVWLNDVKPDESVSWLASIVLAAPETGERRERAAKTAMTAIALHNVPAADRALESFVAVERPEWLRGDTAFWLGSTRGESGARLLTRMIADDPSEKVRDKVTHALSVSRTPAALTTLIATARNDRSRKVRGQALFWLAQRAGKDALATITAVIETDPDTDVKKKAVFALTHMPADEGVPKLIEVARTNRNPEVRKQAMFWLGQSNDPRAVKFFEDILLKK
jgi:HEAT repeats